ncbi:MAG: ABC transporter permease [Actinomycetota bacterium]|nr:ABC transporter permease [Actinomycetota bacterium]
MSSRLRSIWPPVLIAVIALVGWQLLVVVRDIQPYLLPSPSLIASNFFKDVSLMWGAGFYTGTTALLGLMFGTFLGILASLLAQRFVVVNNLITPLAAGLAAVPIIALTPILNNMFNITSRTPRVLVTTIIVFFPIFVNLLRGLVQVQPVQLELMRSMNASPRTVLRILRIPNAIPFFFTGLKVAAPLAVIAALVAEYFGGPQEGLGARIASNAANTAYGRAWAYVLAAIITGLLFYVTVLLLERWAAPWTAHRRSA